MVGGIEHIGITVGDPDKAEPFLNTLLMLICCIGLSRLGEILLSAIKTILSLRPDSPQSRFIPTIFAASAVRKAKAIRFDLV